MLVKQLLERDEISIIIVNVKVINLENKQLLCCHKDKIYTSVIYNDSKNLYPIDVLFVICKKSCLSEN
jgi:hypothetical protein